MALFTGKGDDGKTRAFGGGARISKSSALAEALGASDELNSFLGLAKVKAAATGLEFSARKLEDIIHDVQRNLFIVQAELAGAPKSISEEKLREAEDLVDGIERELPPITSFFISGGTELAALLDVARTLARRLERRAVALAETEERALGEWTRAYLNRLSSVLYALARLANRRSGITEQSPDYR